MFPNEEASKQGVKKRRRLNKETLLIAGGGLFAAGIAAILVSVIFGGASVVIPKDIKDKVRSPIYVPLALPGNYKVMGNSFTMVENGAVLIFQADDGVGAKLIFSEQPRPKDFGFDEFYKGQFKDAKTLSGTPYPSVWGESLDGRLALSMVTNDTWVLMATSAPLNESDMVRIAKDLHRE